MSEESASNNDKPSTSPLNALPSSVPTFGCVIYISRTEDGRTRGRVANLEGIEMTGSSEREVLSRIVPEFKKQVAAMLQENQEVPWIEPVPDPDPNEDKRFLPVHL